MESTGEGLMFEGILPVSFKLIDSFPMEGQFAIINESNENLLKTSLILNESSELDEHDDFALELRRQDLKISLLLDMVGELVAQQNILPNSIAMKLTASSLRLQSKLGENKVGEKLEISLYITPATPKALKLYGEVLSNDEAETVIRFVGVSQGVQDWLEKIIFRHHRRTIAQGVGLRP